MFIGNESSKIVHIPFCEWAWKINSENFVKFDNLYDALSLDYLECQSCLGIGIEIRRKYAQMKKVDEIKKEIKNEMFNKCAICDEERGIQKAHIWPKRYGGNGLIPLCPKCHWNYDHKLLNYEENKRVDIWIQKRIKMHKKQMNDLKEIKYKLGEKNNAITREGFRTSRPF